MPCPVRLACLIACAWLAACAARPQVAAIPTDAQVATRMGAYASVVPLYEALDRIATGGAATLLQIGDSHTANDAFSGRLRDLFQQRFGDAGRGVLPPGIPYRYYKPGEIHVTADGFTVVSAFHIGSVGPFGIAGLRQHADGPARMTLTADWPGGAAQGWVEILRQPGGGHLDLTADTGGTTQATTDGAGIAFLPLPTAPRTTQVTVGARGDGPIDILAWNIQRAAPGIRYANLGTIGATVDILSQFDPRIVAAELAQLHPALILVAFGTNEGFKDNLDTANYPADYAAQVEALAAAAPDAGLLLIAPPDGVRATRTADPTLSCDAAGAGNGYATPRNLPVVRAAIQQVAAAHGWMSWNWQQAMAAADAPDGRCMILRWASLAPPAAARDHVHLLAPGYRQTADDLFATLMRGYAQWTSLKHPH